MVARAVRAANVQPNSLNGKLFAFQAISNAQLRCRDGMQFLGPTIRPGPIAGNIRYSGNDAAPAIRAVRTMIMDRSAVYAMPNAKGRPR